MVTGWVNGEFSTLCKQLRIVIGFSNDGINIVIACVYESGIFRYLFVRRDVYKRQAAVKQCLEHLLENHDRAPGDTKIADMQADGQTLTITTNEPNPALMNYLGDPYGCIIDVDASDFDTGVVIGTGQMCIRDRR